MTAVGSLAHPGRWSALVGGIVWCVLAAGSRIGWMNMGTVELLFLLAALAIVPLGLDLSAQLDGTAPPRLEHWAALAQPGAALLVMASFFFPPGRVSVSCGSAWLLLCALLGWCGFLRLLRGAFAQLDSACTVLALVYIAVGGAWFAASRAALSPLDFEEPIVLLTAVHFHYAGFAAPLLARATGRALRGLSSPARRAFQLLTVGVLAGPALLAGAFVIGPRARLAAGLFLVASQFGLGASIGLASYRVSSRLARMLLRLSSLSLAFGMCLAFLWAWGEYPGQPLLNLAQMARWHGVPNAFGFTLSGLLGWSISGLPSHARGRP
ncbi:MAG TPA: YndJ family transporter [Candidatus Acidoferrales bacterium]|nr:YndJ family transporter [Candidatus Acidoferrales bacterium]